MLVALISAILVSAGGVIFASLHLLESLEDNSKKLKAYKVPPRNPFDKSVVPDFVDYSMIRNGEIKTHQETQRLYRLATQLHKKHDIEAALATYTQAIDSYEKDPPNTKDLGTDRYLLGSCYRGLSDCYLVKDNYEKALEYIEQAYRLRNRRVDLVARAYLYEKLGKTDLALADRKESAARLEEERHMRTNVQF